MISPQDYLTHQLRTVLGNLTGQRKLDLPITVTADTSGHAEFASNIALQAAKPLGLQPIELAQQIAAAMSADAKLKGVEAAGPGFLNFELADSLWLEWFNSLQEQSWQQTSNGQTVSLEFVSANPTGPLVLVGAWQAYYGDILGRILSAQGYQVEREYFVNNAGNQITNLGFSLQAALGKKFSREQQEQFYRGDYVIELAHQLAEAYGTPERVCEQPAYEVGHKAAEMLLDQIKATLLRMGVQFDSFYSDTQVDNERTLKALQDRGAVEQRDGALWLKAAVSGTDKPEVLVRSAGRGPTYFLNDISYQLDRLAQRHYDRVLSIVGPDHHGQALRLTAALQHLGYSNFAMFSTQTVRLVKGGKEYKMSKRAGNYVLLDEFLDLVPSDAARFYFGSRDIHSHLDFDLDAVREQTKNNPLFYCMYAYARACSIIRRAAAAGDQTAGRVTHPLSQRERALLRQVSLINPTLADIAANYRVHNLFSVLIELARLWHDYYESERIIALEDSGLRASKLALVTHLQMVWEVCFSLIGVSPQERM